MPEDPRAADAPTAEAPILRAETVRAPVDDGGFAPKPLGGVPLLRVSWPFALIAVVTVILGRAVGPSIAGTGVGIERLIFIVEMAGKVLSQLFAVAAIVLAMASIIAVSRSRLP